MRSPRSVLGRALAAPGDGARALPGSASAVARRRERARTWSPRTGEVGSGPVARPTAVVDAVLGVLLGLAGWFVLLLVLLSSARGPLYGLVVPGPYDDAWGGPTLAGAWAVHALVWAATLPVAGALLVGLLGLQARLSAHLLGGRRRRWAVVVAVLVVLVVAVVVRAVLGRF